MDKKLFVRALTRFFAGVLIVGALLFIPAGGFAYRWGWLFMGLLFVPMFAAGLVMMAKNPALLERRLNAREGEDAQKAVIAGSALMFTAAFVLAGLNWRFRWVVCPTWLVILGAALFITAYALYAEVLRENEYLSRTVEVQEGQKVVDTGLYGVVRHPMYAVTLVLFLSMPLVLGSPLSLIPMLAYPALIVRRILNEEVVLARGLPGYADYMKKVKYRLMPHIW